MKLSITFLFVAALVLLARSRFEQRQETPPPVDLDELAYQIDQTIVDVPNTSSISARFGTLKPRQDELTPLESSQQRGRQSEQRAVEAARAQPKVSSAVRQDRRAESTDIEPAWYRTLIRREVEAAFAARQELQRAEVARIKQQLERIESSIERRDRIKEQIIERRVDELLKPALKWLPAGQPRAIPVLKDKSLSLTEDPSAAPKTLAGQKLISAFEKGPGNLDSRINNSTNLKKTIADLTDVVTSYEEALKHNPNHDDFGGTTARLRRARRDLAFAQNELDVQVRLSELELKDAVGEVDAAQELVDNLKKLGSGVVSGAEVSRAQRSLGSAQVRRDRAQALFDYFRAVDPLQTEGSQNPNKVEPQKLPTTKVDPAIREYLDLMARRLQLLTEQYQSGEIGLTEVLAAQLKLYDEQILAGLVDRESILQEKMKIVGQLRKTLQALYESGAATQADVLAVEAELLKTRSQLKNK